ncbi:MAG: hemin uptake protein HemP [Planctomycetota bacterium]
MDSSSQHTASTLDLPSRTSSDAVSSVGDNYAAQSVTSDDVRKIVRFESLSRAGEEIWIETEGQIYRLQKTRQGKLILTK